MSGALQAADGTLFHGDCVDALPAASAARGPFAFVYLDPPFNAGGTRAARVGSGERARGVAAYVDEFGGLDAFLEMLGPRLEAIRATLAERWALCLHLDHRAVHDSKVLADKLFGRRAFHGELIWVPGNGARGKGVPATHQTILIYGDSNLRWDASHSSLREPYAATSLSMHFTSTDDAGRAFRERTINGRTYRYYADEGRRLGSVWTDLPSMLANTPLRQETTGYPTQKPLALLERLLRALAPADGSVLDPMCGSGTTLVAARALGRRWAGIDASPLAIEVASRRLQLSPTP